MSSTHEILMRQLPRWFKPVAEYIAIMRAYSAEFDKMVTDLDAVHANMFIQTCDAATIRYWERKLSISVDPGDPLEYRREKVLMRLSRVVPYTEKHLREKLTELFGDEYTLEVNPENCTLKLIITSDRYGAVGLVRELMYQWIPAHLYVYSNQQVTNSGDTGGYYAARCTRTFEQVIGIGGN